MFWVTLLAFLGVCVYTYVAILQVYKSQAANVIASDGIYIANRPYFMVESVSPVNEVDERGALVRYRMGPNWTNFGNSPADNVTVYICDPKITDGSLRPNLVCSLSEKAASNGPVGPKQTWHILGVPVSIADFDATIGGKKSIYIFGYVTYSDGLKPEASHQTRFCQKISKGIAPVGVNAMNLTGCQDTGWSCFDASCFGDSLALR